jgi:ribokinase
VIRAVAYGTLNPDLVHHVARIPAPGDDIRSSAWHLTWGGKAANAAVALATWGVETTLTGLVIGTDALGDALLEALRRPHLDLSAVVRDSGQSTRHCLVFITPEGDRTIVCTGYEGARWSPLPDATFDVALVDGLGDTAGHRAARTAAERGKPVVWLDAPPEAAEAASLVVWSRHDHSIDEIRDMAGRVDLAVTDGLRPVEAWIGGRHLVVMPPAIDVRDATGAGDVFAAACARGLALGLDADAMLRWAVAAGSAAAAAGFKSRPPPVTEVEELMESVR